jgi:hypothetical protein
MTHPEIKEIETRNKANKRIFGEALRRHFIQNPYDLKLCAEKLVAMAKEGDLGAIREIGDRLDGKPKQETETNNRYQINLTREEAIAELRVLQPQIVNLIGKE